MATTGLNIGIVAGGESAFGLAGRFAGVDGVALVGFAGLGPSEAATVAERFGAVPSFPGVAELIASGHPDALAIGCEPPSNYRPAIDGLQAGCHVLLDCPIGAAVQEAADLAGLARARGLTVAVGHRERLLPSLAEARRRVLGGAIGALRLVQATLEGPVGGGLGGSCLPGESAADLLDALLWTTGESAAEVSAFGTSAGPTLAASIRLSGGTLATLSVTGIAPASLEPRSRFSLAYHGEAGRLVATEAALFEGEGESRAQSEGPGVPTESIEGDFLAALRSGAPPRCPAEQALETARLLEAICRSATTGQVVRLG